MKPKFLNENGLFKKTVLLNGIEYSLNEEENTSNVFKAISVEKTVVIPRSINYQSKEYIVTSISSRAFRANFDIESLCFADDSEIRTICKYAFENSGIRYLEIPSSVINLNKGWCNVTSSLYSVKVSAQNPYYYSINDSIIIGKSLKESEIFDVLVFCSRNCFKIKIPSFIKFIDPYAFEYCNFIDIIQFPVDSNLEIISKYAFYYVPIKNKCIKFPPHLTKICKYAFSYCQFDTIEFPDDSELQTIEEYAFSYSELKHITFPPNLRQIEMGAFYGTPMESLTISKNLKHNYGWCDAVNLVHIDVSPDNPYYKSYENKYIIGKSSNDSENYDVLVFAPRDIVIAEIPDFIKSIGSFSFDFCNKLKEIKSSDNSNLQSIQINAFSKSSLEKITIPASFCEFKKGWCNDVIKLNNIIISSKNPHFILFENTFILKKSNEERQEYDSLQFARRDIEIAIIPSFVKIISNYSFYNCKKLKKVVINADSKLEIIEKMAFASSAIQSFTVPSHLTKICKNAFGWCDKLEIFEIPIDSELSIIEEKAFFFSSITSITIPPHIKHIMESTFDLCRCLKKIEFASNSEFQTIGATSCHTN